MLIKDNLPIIQISALQYFSAITLL